MLLLVILRFWTLRTVVRLTAVLAARFLVLRFTLVAVGAPLARLYNGPNTQADQLLLGGCGRTILFASISHGSRVHTSLQAGSYWAGPIAGLALVAALFALSEPTTRGAWFDVFWTSGPTVLALLAALVIGSMVLRPASGTGLCALPPGPGQT